MKFCGERMCPWWCRLVGFGARGCAAPTDRQVNLYLDQQQVNGSCLVGPPFSKKPVLLLCQPKMPLWLTQNWPRRRRALSAGQPTWTPGHRRPLPSLRILSRIAAECNAKPPFRHNAVQSRAGACNATQCNPFQVEPTGPRPGPPSRWVVWGECNATQSIGAGGFAPHCA